MSGYPASTIVIPAYNESARIEATLREVVREMALIRWNALWDRYDGPVRPIDRNNRNAVSPWC
ncbi:MAG TPA: hypothetical protein VHZ52_14645 [Acidobacteriaceae bacterium]|nr:hypothetical protein [Acidobacteriaceae bacterium]